MHAKDKEFCRDRRNSVVIGEFWPGFKVWEGKKHFYGGKIFVFIIRLKQIFWSQPNWGGTAPVTTGLSEFYCSLKPQKFQHLLFS